MRISLITINRNNAEGLERTLRSVYGQELSAGIELEHIIVDGQSTDASAETIRRFAPQSLLAVCEPKGVYDAINRGLGMASGHVVGLLHSGDTFASPQVLNYICQVFENETDVDFVYGDVTIGRRYYPGLGLSRARLAQGFAPPHPSLYMRQHVVRQVGVYDVTLRIAADFDYFVRLAESNKALTGKYLPFRMVDMEPGGLSQQTANRLWHNNTERLRALRKAGIKSNRWRLMSHYITVIKGFICSSKKK